MSTPIPTPTTDAQPVLCFECDTPALDVRIGPSALRPDHIHYDYWCPECRAHRWHTTGPEEA